MWQVAVLWTCPMLDSQQFRNIWFQINGTPEKSRAHDWEIWHSNMTPNASYSVYCCSYEALLNNHFKLRVKIYTLDYLSSHLLHLFKSKRWLLQRPQLHITKQRFFGMGIPVTEGWAWAISSSQTKRKKKPLRPFPFFFFPSSIFLNKNIKKEVVLKHCYFEGCCASDVFYLPVSFLPLS